MRRKVQNKKVLRAITIGLAAVLSVTSTPLPVFAAEGVDGTNGVQPSGTEETTTTTSSSTESTQGLQGATSDATIAANAAEGKAGTLSDTTPATGTGEVGTSVANALNDVASGEAVLELYGMVAPVESNVDKLLSEEGPGDNGLGQIKNSEKKEKAAEEEFGVKLNDDGSVKNQDKLNQKVSDANNKISTAEDAKRDAYNKLKGTDGLDDKINTANRLISDANSNKTAADEATETANGLIEGVSTLNSETQSKLNDIEAELDKVIYDKDGNVVLEKAVGDVTKAAGDAAGVANDQLTAVQGLAQKAKDAADDAESHSGSYTYQQMATLANNAQVAANNAKAAADFADKAVAALDEKEKEANTALTNATNALSKAQGDAAEVLKAYKKTLDEINNKIDAANDSRFEAKTAMENANDAIDAALKLMEDTSDPSAETVKKKIEAMNTAIKAANSAISTVTGLTNTKEFTDATDRYGWTQQRLNKEIEKFETAKTTYAAVIEAKKEATDYQESAQSAVNAIDEIMNGKDGKPGWFDAQIAEVDNDLKALLSTGGASSYQDLQNTANGVGGEVKSQGDALVNLNKELGGSEEDQNLTADQIVEKYNNALNVNNAVNKKYVYTYNEQTKTYELATDEEGKPVYTDAYKTLVATSKEKTEEIAKYKNGNDELEPEQADYTDADGNIYKKKSGNPTPSTEDGYYKPGRYQLAWTTGDEKVINRTIEGGFLKEMTEVTYEQPLTWKTDYLKADACENDAFTITEDDYNRLNELEGEEQQKLAKEIIIAHLFEDKDKFNIGKVENIELSGDTAIVTVKDPDANHTNASLVYVFDCDIEYKFADDAWKDYFGIQLNYKLNEFSEQKGTRLQVGMFRETKEYGYTRYDKHVVTPAEYTDAAIKAQTDLAKIDADADSLLSAYDKNQKIIDKLGTNVSQYTLAVNFKTAADEQLKNANNYIFDIDKLSAEDKAKYEAILTARQTIIGEKSKAKGYFDKLKEELEKFDGSILAADGKTDGVDAYNRVAGKIEGAKNRLTAVSKKLNSLEALQEAAVKEITGKGNLVNKNYTVDGETIDIEKLNTILAGDLKGLKKFDDVDKYAPLDNVSDYRKLDELSLDVVNGDLAGKFNNIMDLITGQSGILKETVGTLENISEAKKKLLSDVEKIHDFAKKAQDEADRAATALKNWRAPYVPGDDDDDEESSTDTGIIYTNQGVTITGLDLAAIGAGTGTGIRAVAGARTGVAGVRTEADIQNPQVPLAGSVSTNSNTTTAANGEETTANIGDNLVPLAEAPFEKGTEMNLAWLLSLAAAAAAGVGVYAYDRKRKLANAEEEAKKYKK